VLTQPDRYSGIIIHYNPVKGPDFVSSKPMLREFGVVGVFRGAEAREYDRNSSAYSLRTIKNSLRRHKQPFDWFPGAPFPWCFPRRHGSAKEKNLGSGALGYFGFSEMKAQQRKILKVLPTFGCFSRTLSCVVW
jgi:hypothetical protein